MRIFSIFARKPEQSEPESAHLAEDGADRAQRLFGIPPQQMTRHVRAAFKATMGEVDSLRSEIEELKQNLAMAEEAADHDALVPVYNRRAFMREASKIASMVRRHEVEASLIYFDLNNFKEVNDLHGHAAGDVVLRSIGEILLRQTRETDVVGRIGGDEFAVVLTHVGADAAREKAEALAAAIRTDRMLHDGVELDVSASIGVANFNLRDSVESILGQADEAMFADKALHRRAQGGGTAAA